MITLLFMVAALVLFLLAAVSVPAPPRLNFEALGLACITAAWIAGHYAT